MTNKNYYMNKNNEAVIRSFFGRTDIDGVGTSGPTIDIACDVFDSNARAVVTGKLNNFVQCNMPADNLIFWHDVHKNCLEAMETEKIKDYQSEFAKHIRNHQ